MGRQGQTPLRGIEITGDGESHPHPSPLPSRERGLDLPSAARNGGFWGLVLAEAEGSAGESAGVLAFVYYYFAVDDDVGDAEGELLGVFSGGGGFDGFGVEDDNVGLVAVAEEATGLETQALGGEGGHLADGLGEAELLFGAYVLSEDDGEAAIGAGAGELSHENGVASDHAAGVRDEGGEGLGVGADANNTEVEAIVEDEVEESLHGVLAAHLAHFFDQEALILLVVLLLEVGEPVGGRVAVAGGHIGDDAGSVVRVGEDFEYALGAAVHGPEWELNGGPSAGVDVGVAVECHVHALGAGVFYEADVVKMRPDTLGALSVVGEVDGDAAFAPNLDGLVPGGKEALGLEGSTGVGMVEAALGGSGLGKLDELIGVGVAAGRVV